MIRTIPRKSWNNTEKDNPLQSGSIVEAITSRGMETVLITQIDSEKYSGYLLSRQPGILAGEVEGIRDELFEEIEDMRGIVISSVDDSNYGLYVLRDGNEISVFHQANGELVDKVRSPQQALAIVGHKLVEYADSAEEAEMGDWSKTRAQGENMNNDLNKKFFLYSLGIE